MSRYGTTHKGGLFGILTTVKQQSELSRLIDSSYINEYVNIPKIKLKDQLQIIHDCDCSGKITNWENETHKGTCCTICGKTETIE